MDMASLPIAMPQIRVDTNNKGKTITDSHHLHQELSMVVMVAMGDTQEIMDEAEEDSTWHSVNLLPDKELLLPAGTAEEER